MKYVQLLPSDDTFSAQQLSKMINNCKKYDLTLSFHYDDRILIRRFISKSYTELVNIFFGYDYNYYNGITIIKKQILKKINFKSKSPFFMAEIILGASKMKKRIIFKKLRFVERKHGKTSIFNVKNSYNCLMDLLKYRFNIND